MSNYKRPVICWGNDFTIKIELQQFLDGEFIDFNINDVKSLEVYLICSTHQQKIPLDWKIEPGFDNVISCDVDYRLTHPNTSYGIGVEGIDKYDKHFRWYMTGKEGILIVPNTSGQNIPQDTEVVDLVGRVGWGIQADLTNYYTKIEVNELLDQKVDKSELTDDYYDSETIDGLLEAKADTADLSTVATTGDYNDLSNKPDLSQYATHSELNLKQDVLISGENIKTINNQSLLGSGNIDIQGGGGSSYTAGQNIDITNNVISTTNDIDAETLTAGDFKIKEIKSGTVHYTRWTDTANRYLAEEAMHGNELRMGDQWYTYGNNATLYVDTQNDGVNIIPYTEWTYTDDIPSWMPGYITAAYKSATTVNGYPVYGAYNPDSDSPDFYIYDADNYDITSMWVDYIDIPSEKPLTYWKVKGKGMYVDTDNTTNVTFGDGDRQISIGTNNTFGYAGNVVMIGNGLTGEYMTEQLIVGRYNKEKNALFAVGNGHSDSTFYSYSRSIDNDYTCTVWTELHEEFFNENGDVEIRVIKNDPEWTVLFECRPLLSISHLNDSNPYSENIEVEYQGTTYYGIATMQRDGNNLGVTFELYTDEQHTTPYNIFASPAEVDLSFVWFPISYSRDAFFVNEDGQIYMPNYQDINTTFNLGEAIYNLEQRPQPVQSDWNEGDGTSLAYIQNKPDLSTKQDTLVSGTNIKTINNQSLLGSGNIDIQGAYYVDVTSILMGQGTDVMWNEFAAAVQANRPIVTNLMGIYYTCDSVRYPSENECIVSAGDNISHYIYTITRNGVDDFTVTYTSDAWNNKVTSFNGQTGDVTYTAPVTSVNGMTGAVTIQTGGVQSDWTETDTTSLAYIQNKPDLSTKQDTLVSGTNIKTINGNDILGSGDLVISGGDKPYEEQYLTFTALEDTKFELSRNALKYSLDNGTTWTTLAAGTESPTITAGNKILWKQTGLTPAQYYGIGIFGATGNFEVSGNIMSLLFGDDFIDQTSLSGKNYTFYNLFNGTKLINAKNLILPATTLSTNCYQGMFGGCRLLKKSPKLPATILAANCYNGMFQNCRLLTTAPELPATTLATYCYQAMFSNCTSLTTAPELPATTLATYCYQAMFAGCTSLTTAPELPATTLRTGCYKQMFDGLTNLNYIKCLATNISASNCTDSWVNGVSATGIFVKADNAPAWTTGTSGIPTGWNSYTEAQYEVVRHYELSNVATSGSYNDLTNTPDLTYKVGSTTQNMQIEVVSAMPATPDSSTLYLVV